MRTVTDPTCGTSAHSETATPFPEIILNKSGISDLLYRLFAIGEEEIGAACLIFLHKAVSVRPFGGYYLPWRTTADLEAFCTEQGISTEAMTFLYEANLLDLPRDGAPASLSVNPGYSGPLRRVRIRQCRHMTTGG